MAVHVWDNYEASKTIKTSSKLNQGESKYFKAYRKIEILIFQPAVFSGEAVV